MNKEHLIGGGVTIVAAVIAVAIVLVVHDNMAEGFAFKKKAVSAPTV